MRCAVDDIGALEKLLTIFFGYARPEVAEFRKAVTQFKTDLPSVLESLRAMIERAHAENPAFRTATEVFLRHAQETIDANCAQNVDSAEPSAIRLSRRRGLPCVAREMLAKRPSIFESTEYPSTLRLEFCVTHFR